MSKKGLGLKTKNIDLSGVRGDIAPVQSKGENGEIAPVKKYTSFEIYMELFLKWKTVLTMRRVQMADFLNELVDDFLNNKLKLEGNDDERKKLPLVVEPLNREFEVKKVGFSIEDNKDTNFKLKLSFNDISQREFFTCFIQMYVDQYYNQVLKRIK